MKLPEDIADTLRRARAVKHLSQRELGERTGVPQSHISKIEQGAVDLRVSSLKAIANALDLDIALVPKKAMPAVKSIARSADQRASISPEKFAKQRYKTITEVNKELMAKALMGPAEHNPRPAYRLDDDDDDA